MKINYQNIRDEFANVLNNVPGVYSVGLGKEGGEIVLVAIIDSTNTVQNISDRIPDSFRGVNVVFRHLDAGRLYFKEKRSYGYEC